MIYSTVCVSELMVKLFPPQVWLVSWCFGLNKMLFIRNHKLNK